MKQEIFDLIARIEILSRKLQYGTLTCNVVLSDGLPNLNTLHITSMKRKRYPPNKKLDSDPSGLV
jgi:hypothetical protein